MTGVEEALRGRISTRAFLPDPIPEADVRAILDAARWAPSGGNLQPWRVIAVTGAALEASKAVARQALQEHPEGEEGAYPIYPANLWEPHRSRRFKVGEDLYALLGIPREDKFARFAQLARNYEFFGAPVALFVLTDTRMGHGQWAHLGMFMQSIALAAHARGLATCMQEAWGRVRESLKAHLGLGETELVYCAIALGRADPEAPVNRLRSERASVEEIAEFRGF